MRLRRRLRVMSSRPSVESLEGRTLMAFTALDPSFGTGGVVVSTNVDPASVVAAAVQPDGKVVDVTSSFTIDIGSVIGVSRLDADGSVDTTFNTTGSFGFQAPADFLDRFNDTAVAPKDVVIQPDGKIVVSAAFTAPANNTSMVTEETVVVRLNADGSLDTTFGTGGKVVISSKDAGLNSVALQSDGKIVIAGSALAPGGTARSAAVARLDADGTLDATFNGGAVETFDSVVSNPPGTVSSLAIDPTTGKIVLAGTVDVFFIEPQMVAGVIRLDTDGTPDATFGIAGFEQTNSDQVVAAVAVQPDSKILIAGNSLASKTAEQPVLARLNADGTDDQTFFGAFVIPTGFLNYKFGFSVGSLALQPDGKILVGGVQPRTSHESFAVDRFNTDGSLDQGFGIDGQAAFTVPGPTLQAASFKVLSNTATAPGLALGADGSIALVGNVTSVTNYMSGTTFTQRAVARLLPIAVTRITAGDYDGDGKSDVAAYLPNSAIFAYRPSGGGPDVLTLFGALGSIPAPGDYDGDGRADIAVYIPSLGAFGIRPSGGGADEVIPFGLPGAGASIPAPGDYDGDGKTDLAIYIPSLAVFAYRPSSGGADVIVPFGAGGAGATIPAPGDYDDDGKTDIAAYLPAYGEFAVRPSSGGNDEIMPFGVAGAGGSIPAPADYNGDGFTDIAVSIPSQGVFAYRPSNSSSNDQIESFGIAGAGKTIPAPGDYDGDGRADIAAYLPSLGLYAYRPSTGANDVLESFGPAGAGATIPASSIPYAQGVKVSASSIGSGAVSAAVVVPLTDDLMPSPGSARRKAAGLLG